MSCPAPGRSRFCALQTCCTKLKIVDGPENDEAGKGPKFPGKPFGPKSNAQQISVVGGESFPVLSSSPLNSREGTPRGFGSRDVDVGLQKAMKRNHTRDLRVAVENAVQAGRDDSELAEAKQQLEALRVFAWESLARAVDGEDDANMRKAVENATTAGLLASEIADAKETFKSRHEHSAEKNRLKIAMKRNKTQDLRDALEDAIKAGIDDSELTDAKAQLEALKCFTWESLERAVEEEDDAHIRVALDNAAAAGLEASELEDARGVLKSLQETRQPMVSLQQAMRRNQTQDLRDALEGATKAGIDDSELTAAKAQMAALRCFTYENLARAVESEDDARIRRALDNAAAAGLPESEMAEAKEALKANQNGHR